jgi:hypothetical protein
MGLTDDFYQKADREVREVYGRTDPVKASILTSSAAAALYAASDPSGAEWVDTAGHMATGAFGSSLTDLAYDYLEPGEKVEKTRKPAMILGGLATGNIGQTVQGLGFIPGNYDLESVGEAGLAATANALGAERYSEKEEK